MSIFNRDEPYLVNDQSFDEESKDAGVYAQNIVFDFKPPNKQFDNDINSRSGGEKTIAGLALVFALAQERKPQTPPLLLLDEVDAHLDQDNIALLVKFIKKWNEDPKNVNRP